MGSAPDYGTRPSKMVCRRIFIEALRRMQAIDKLSNFKYVGFGSYQFVDFDLVHRHLGITDMTSIEADADLLPRCHFNMPYRGIKIAEGTSTTVIPSLDWSGQSIVWLDYTQRLRTNEISDCENVALRLTPGSVLAITLNCDPGADGKRRDALADAVGSDRVPIGTSEAKLAEWGLANIQRELVSETVHRTLGARNDGTAWQQLLNIHYKDAARMQMIVGIVDHPDIHQKIDACRFHEMDEISSDADALEVEIPVLTARERQMLGKKLPSRRVSTDIGIPERELQSYGRFYRWLDSVG